MKSIYLSSSISVMYLTDFCSVLNYFYVIEGNIPCYRIELISESEYCLSIVMVGFLKNELEVIFQKNVLIIYSGKIVNKNYLYSSIVKNHFKYEIGILEGMKIIRVDLKNGLLNIYLKHVSKHLDCSTKYKSRSIEIAI